MGLILLLVLAACFLLWTGAVVVLRISKRPSRDGIGRALAQGRPSEPSEVGLACREWMVRTTDGLDLPVWDADTGIDGPTVIWLHDWGQSRLGLLPRLPAWAAWCGRIVAPDMRGHGDAPGTCTLGQLEREDLAALLELVGDEPIILAGEGLGAVLALEIALRGKANVSGVFALDPFVSGSARFRVCMREQGYPPFPVADLALIWLWLGSRSPIELKWRPSAVDVPVLARFTGYMGTPAEEDAAVFKSIVPAGSPVEIEVRPGAESDSAGSVERPWW